MRSTLTFICLLRYHTSVLPISKQQLARNLFGDREVAQEAQKRALKEKLFNDLIYSKMLEQEGRCKLSF